MAQREADDKEQRSAEHIGRGVGTSGGSAGNEAVGQADQVRPAHNVQAAGILDQVHHLIHHRGQNDLDGLGQDDIKHGRPVTKALALGCLKLPGGDGLDARPDYLRHIGPGVYPQGHNAGDDDVHLEAGKGQHVVQKAHLQHHRGILDELHVHPGDPSKHTHRGGGHEPEEESQGQSQQQRHSGGF